MRRSFLPVRTRVLAASASIAAAVVVIGIGGGIPVQAARLSGPAVASLNCDVYADLLARSSAGQLHLYKNENGEGLTTFSSTPGVVGTGWGAYSELSVGYVNGDNCADLLARSSTGALHLYHNNPTGSGFSYFQSTPETVGTGWGSHSEINLGDVNNDGYADLLARTSTGALHLYYNTGGGAGSGLSTFFPTANVVGTGWGSHSEINLGDVDNDGYADLLARTSTGALHLHYNTGGGTGLSTFFHNPDVVGTGWGGYSELSLGNNFDVGFANLLARSSSGALHLYYNTNFPSNPPTSTFAAIPDVVGTGWGGYSEINLG